MMLIRCQATYLLLISSIGLEYDESECHWAFPGTRSQGAGMHPLGRIGKLDVNLFSLS
jgi:hypothetical protein